MTLILPKKREILSLFIWSFFSFSVIQFLSVFIYAVKSNVQLFLLLIVLYSSLSFLNYFVLKARFGIKLNYPQYLVCNLVFGILITAFSYSYHLAVMLTNDRYSFGVYIGLLLSNLLLGSILYLFTLINGK
jgi:hypothetical protein